MTIPATDRDATPAVRDWLAIVDLTEYGSAGRHTARFEVQACDEDHARQLAAARAGHQAARVTVTEVCDALA